MIRDITIGQYYRADSVIHRLDPRVKLAGTLLFIFQLFLFSHPVTLALTGLLLAVEITVSNVPFSYMIRGLKSIFFILLFTVFFQLFFTKGDTALHLWKITVTWQGIHSACLLSVRFIMLILSSSLMTLTTTPNQLTDGLERLLSPLKRLHVPVHEVAMMMSIALRFIPILMEEADKIIKAQTARGADFESGGLVRRARSLVPILVPLFTAAFRRADELALAMEARCYRGGEGRTRMKPLKYEKRDGIAYNIAIGCFLLELVLKIAL